MDNTMWPFFVTQAISYLMAFAYTFLITRHSIHIRNYGGWLCLLCLGAAGFLVVGPSKHLSALLDHMECSLWKEPLWVMVCNIGIFFCAHFIYLFATTESQPISDPPPSHSSFPGPEGLDRGDYTVNLLIKLETNRTRFMNNERREEGYRVSAGELPPFLRGMGEGVDDPPSSGTDDEDEDNTMPYDVPHCPDFWNFVDPTDGSPMEYPRIRPENLYRRPVSIPGFPRQGLTRMRPTTPRPRTKQEGQPPTARVRSVSPNTARNYPLYTGYVTTRLFSPQLSMAPTMSLPLRPSGGAFLAPEDEEVL